MNDYNPDKWMLVKVNGQTPHYRIFGSWYGGFAGADEWRLNSGVESVREEGNFYIFEGTSGSTYSCHKEAYGASSFGMSVVLNYEKKSQGTMTIIHEQPDIMSIDWSCKSFSTDE
jgi:hypothetical protein